MTSQVCGRRLVLGPRQDPSGTDCEREAGHDGKHRGDDPFCEEGFYVDWHGGVPVGGDQLLGQDLAYIEAAALAEAIAEVNRVLALVRAARART